MPFAPENEQYCIGEPSPLANEAENCPHLQRKVSREEQQRPCLQPAGKELWEERLWRKYRSLGSVSHAFDQTLSSWKWLASHFELLSLNAVK